MSDTKPFTPDDAYAKIVDLERRLKALETAPRLPNTSFDIATGIFRINAPAGNTLLYYDKAGLSLPALPVPLVAQIAAGAAHTVGSCLVTAPADTIIYSASLFAATANALSITIPWITDAATTGAVAVSNNIGGGLATSVVTLPAGSSGFVSFNWLHGNPIGGGPFQPSIVARRLTGVGNVNIFQPADCKIVGGAWIGATATGL